jgi:ferritin-like metal-binding protein YciE
MCWQCEQIDVEIEHYRGLCARAGDEGSIKCLNILIEKLEAERNAIHNLKLNFLGKTSPRC